MTISIKIIDCEQGSDEWRAARRGIPTTSKFQTILAGGEGRATYLNQLAAEIITGEDTESYSNEHMERGKAMEAEARRWYQAMHPKTKVRQVGHIHKLRNDKVIAGCSPDALLETVNPDGSSRLGVLEIKTTLPHLLIPILQAQKKSPGYRPAKHVAQCQGAIDVAGAEFCDLVIYWPKMPPFLCSMTREERYQSDLRDAIDVFNVDLKRLVRSLEEM